MKIAFDFDGTLINTMPLLKEEAIKLLGKAGMAREEALEGYLRTAGAPFKQQISELGLSINDKEFESKKERIVITSGIFDDVVLTLKILRKLKHRVAVVSSTRREVVEKGLKINFIAGYFDEIYGIEDDFGKEKQIKQFGADIFIGDTNRDEKYAKEAGVKFIPIIRDRRFCSLKGIYKLYEIFELRSFNG